MGLYESLNDQLRCNILTTYLLKRSVTLLLLFSNKETEMDSQFAGAKKCVSQDILCMFFKSCAGQP